MADSALAALLRRLRSSPNPTAAHPPTGGFWNASPPAHDQAAFAELVPPPRGYSTGRGTGVSPGHRAGGGLKQLRAAIKVRTLKKFPLAIGPGAD